MLTNALRAKLRTYEVFKRINLEPNSIALLAMIRAVWLSDSENKYKPQLVHEMIRKFYFFKQERNIPNSMYFEKY